MDLNMSTLSNVNTKMGIVVPKCDELHIAPSRNTNEGASTNYAQKANCNDSDDEKWYAMRTTYGREQKAFEYVVEHGGTAFLPLRLIYKKGTSLKSKKVSRFPNIFFIKGTEEEVKTFAYDNVHLPFLRFYYAHKHDGINIIKYPLVVPEKQIEQLRIICNSESEDTMIVPHNVPNFANGELVRVIEGDFKGIEGRVSRWHGQQRVGITIEGLCTIATAYIPTAFLESVN